MPIALRETAAVRIARGPIVLDGPVLTRTSIFAGESSEFVVRLDKRSGKELWRRKGIFPNRALVSDGRGVACTMYGKNDRKSYFLDAKT